MGLDCPETFHPHFLPARADRVLAMAERFDALRDHVGGCVIGEVGVATSGSVWFLCVDCGSVAIETFLERVLGLTHILNSAHPARNEIY